MRGRGHGRSAHAVERDLGRGQRRGRARRLRGPGTTDHRGPTAHRQGGERPRRAARGRPRLPRQGRAGPERRAGVRRRPAGRPAGRVRAAGRALSRTVRFSNASGAPARLQARPARRRAPREVSPDEQHDLLATNFPVSHARDARQFVAFAVATAGGTQPDLRPDRLVFRFGSVRNGADAARSGSTAAAGVEPRGDLLEPRRHALGRPTRCASCSVPPRAPRRPRAVDARSRLSRGVRQSAVRRRRGLELCVQRYVDGRRRRSRTPRSNGPRQASPPVRWRRCAATARPHGRRRPRAAPGSSTRWASTRGTRPRSSGRSATSTARARRPTTPRSAHRLGLPLGRAAAAAERVLGAEARAGFRRSTAAIPWHRLPLTLGLLNLDTLRHELRQQNLHRHRAARGAARRHGPSARAPAPRRPARRAQLRRQSTTTSPTRRWARSARRFGRNMEPIDRPDLFDEPNPVTVSAAAAQPRALHPGPLAQRPRRGVDPVPGARLGGARAPPARRSTTSRCRCRRTCPGSTPRRGRSSTEMRIADNLPLDRRTTSPLRQQRPRIGGTARRSTATDQRAATKLRDGAKLKLDDGYLPDDVPAASR